MTDEEERGFRVRDRRRFTESGDPREEEGSEEASDESRTDESEPERETSERPRPEAPGDEESFPITFSTFLISLSTQALACLGDLAESDEGDTEIDIRAAREMIDILGMLRDKTQGNLDSAEASLLEGILYDLRMRYVKKVRS